MARTYSNAVWILILATVATCLIPVKAVSDCDSRSERADAYQQCFSDEGLEAPDIFDGYRNSDSDDVDEVPVEEMYQKYGEAFCANRSSMKDAVRCSYQIDIDCETTLERSLAPTADQMADTVDAICDNLENLDFMCIKRRQSNTGDCVQKRLEKEEETISSSTLQEIICLSRLIMAECIKRELKTCGCASSQVYSNNTMDILTPNSCDQTTSRVICSPTDPNKFVDDGIDGVTRHGLAIGLLPFSLLVVMVIVG